MEKKNRSRGERELLFVFSFVEWEIVGE